MRKREARLKAGVAFSFFMELEQPEIAEADTILPSEQRYRFVVRPSIKWRVTGDLRVEGHCYFKLPAFRPQRRNDEWDYRVDAQVVAALKLSEDKEGNEKVSLNVRYDYRFDNMPPSVGLNGMLYTARKSHSTASLGISVAI